MRDAFRVAQEERPGPVHLELPEDIAAEEAETPPLIPPHPIELPGRPAAALDRAAAMILARQAAAGHDRRRGKPARASSSRCRPSCGARGIPFFNTQMGKGAVTGGSNLYMGTAALSERDYVHEADRRRPT